jgi:hypothetical protein
LLEASARVEEGSEAVGAGAGSDDENLPVVVHGELASYRPALQDCPASGYGQLAEGAEARSQPEDPEGRPLCAGRRHDRTVLRDDWDAATGFGLLALPPVVKQAQNPTPSWFATTPSRVLSVRAGTTYIEGVAGTCCVAARLGLARAGAEI